MSRFAAILLIAILSGCTPTQQIKTLTAISRTIKLVPDAMKVACDGTVAVCASQKLNPCKLLNDCAAAEKKVHETAIALEQLVADALNAIDLGKAGTAMKLAVALEAARDLDKLLSVWGIHIFGSLF